MITNEAPSWRANALRVSDSCEKCFLRFFHMGVNFASSALCFQSVSSLTDSLTYARARLVRLARLSEPEKLVRQFRPFKISAREAAN